MESTNNIIGNIQNCQSCILLILLGNEFKRHTVKTAIAIILQKLDRTYIFSYAWFLFFWSSLFNSYSSFSHHAFSLYVSFFSLFSSILVSFCVSTYSRYVTVSKSSYSLDSWSFFLWSIWFKSVIISLTIWYLFSAR